MEVIGLTAHLGQAGVRVGHDEQAGLHERLHSTSVPLALVRGVHPQAGQLRGYALAEAVLQQLQGCCAGAGMQPAHKECRMCAVIMTL